MKITHVNPNCKDATKCKSHGETGDVRYEDTKLKVNLVNYEQNYGMDAILSKYARMMERELIDLGHKVTVSGKVKKADINHHINYISYVPSGGVDTTMITHLSGDKNQSEEEKIALVKKQLKTSYGICMNDELKEKLVKAGCDEKRLFVSGHAHDSIPRRPRIISIVSNLYPDGRKREEMFAKLVKSLKNQKQYIFRIMGKDWMRVLDPLRETGLQVQYMDGFTADLYQQFLNTSDYLLYTGDEDSLGQSLIDAKNAGLKIIAPPRKELTVEYPFVTQKDLNRIFEQMAENEVETWTWESFAKTHETIWEKLR